MVWPRASLPAMPSPLRYIPIALEPLAQSPSSIGWPSSASHTMSLRRSPSPVRTVLPVKKRLRWNVGWLLRRLATAEVNSMSGLSARSQCTQLISESWA